ncbi:MAG: hypothetical protein M1831_002200 [Alyxoria varia]|nr:MAG: hypothetical protein M1831_002200 [Alyxoria varia]
MTFRALPVVIILICLFALPLFPLCVKHWLNRNQEWLRHSATLRRARLLTLFTIITLIFLPIYLCICWTTILRSARTLLSDPQIRDQNPATADDVYGRLQNAETISLGAMIPICTVVAGIFLFVYRLCHPTGHLWPDTFALAQLCWSIATLCTARAFELENDLNDIKTRRRGLNTLSTKRMDDYLLAMGFTATFVALGGVMWFECVYRSLSFRYMPPPIFQQRDSRTPRRDWFGTRRREQHSGGSRRNWFGRTRREPRSAVPELPSTVSWSDRIIYRDEVNRATWPQPRWF